MWLMRIKGDLKWTWKIGAAFICWASICCRINKLFRQSPNHTQAPIPCQARVSKRDLCISLGWSAASLSPRGFLGLDCCCVAISDSSISKDLGGKQKGGRSPLSPDRWKGLVRCSWYIWAFCLWVSPFVIINTHIFTCWLPWAPSL